MRQKTYFATTGIMVPLRETLVHFCGRAETEPAPDSVFPGARIFACPLERPQLRGLLRHFCGLSVHRLRLVGQLERLGWNQMMESPLTLRISAFWASAIG